MVLELLTSPFSPTHIYEMVRDRNLSMAIKREKKNCIQIPLTTFILDTIRVMSNLIDKWRQEILY